MSSPATYASSGFYLYLSSVDSVEYFPSNTSDNFIVKLPELYKLRGHWEVALTEIHLPARAGQTAESFSVYSDICEETVIGGIKKPVLRKLFNTTDEATFSQYYYIPVSSDDFRLLSGEGVDKKFRVELLDVAILGCYVTLDPEVVKAHTKSLEKEKAIYPYTSTQMKSFAVPKGQFSASFGDIYSRKVPNNLVLGIVSAEAAAGSQQKNPFNFQHCDLESVTLYVNDQSIPFKPLEFNFDEDLYTAGYLSLFSLQHDIGCDVGLDIRLSDYGSGYCLIAFDIKAEVVGTEQSLPSYGNVKLDIVPQGPSRSS